MCVCVCACTRRSVYVCVQRGRANKLQEPVCVLQYKDIGGLYKDSNISMCKEPGSDCLTVWLLLRALQSAAGMGRETKTHNRGHRRREREACPDNSTRLYITKQLGGPVTTHCVCVHYWYSECVSVLMSHLHRSLTTVHYITLERQAAELQLPLHYTTLTHCTAVNATSRLLSLCSQSFLYKLQIKWNISPIVTFS